jgi:O-antigen/teichoic acid export membrane protein
LGSLITKYKTVVKDIMQKKSVKDISWMIGANILINPLQAAKGFIVAKYLGPEDYGIIKSVELIQMLNKFGDLGFNSTVIRDVGASMGGKNEAEIQEIKNNAYSSELVLTFVLFITGLLSVFFFQSQVIRSAIILSSIGLFTLKIHNLFATEAIINKRFKLISKLVVLQGIINSIVIITTVPFLKIYAVLAIPIISTSIIIFIYFKQLKIPFRFQFNNTRFKNVFRTSIKFTLGTLSFGVFRYTERIIVITMLGLQAVGFYGFANTILALFVTIFLTNIKVRKMDILEYLGKKEFKRVHKIVVKETTALTLVSFVLVGPLMVGLSILIPMFLDKWIDGIFIAQIFLLILPLKVVNSYMLTVVKSPVVNKLFYSPILQLLATATLLVGSFTMKWFGVMTLENFVYLDIFAYSIVHLTWIYVYYKEYYKTYVKAMEV